MREVLRHTDVELVDLVDLDPAVTDLGRRDLRLTRLNDNALSRPKVRILSEDGFAFLQRAHEAYGVIIIDLPDLGGAALLRNAGLPVYTVTEFAGH